MSSSPSQPSEVKGAAPSSAKPAEQQASSSSPSPAADAERAGPVVYSPAPAEEKSPSPSRPGPANQVQAAGQKHAPLDQFFIIAGHAVYCSYSVLQLFAAFMFNSLSACFNEAQHHCMMEYS